MEKINLKIEKHEDKTSQAGKDYTRFLTNEGWMTVFNKEVIESLKKNKGKYVCVSIATSTGQSGNEFRNIRQFHGLAEEGNGSFEVHPMVVKPEDYKSLISKPNGNGSMYASYAKDIFCTVYDNLSPEAKNLDYEEMMKKAIELVKQAKKAFE